MLSLSDIENESLLGHPVGGATSHKGGPSLTPFERPPTIARRKRGEGREAVPENWVNRGRVIVAPGYSRVPMPSKHRKSKARQ